MEEMWMAIRGFPGYEASNLGRLRSIDRLVMHKDGIETRRRGQQLRPSPGAGGYLKVKILGRTALVHRLIMLAFLGPPAEGMAVAHNDGNRQNSRLDNLRYATHRENCADKNRHGTQRSGENHPNAKISNATACSIRVDAEFLSIREITAKYGICRSAAYRIIRGQSWASAGGDIRTERKRGRKLTPDDVAAIISAAATKTYTSVAREHGVSITMVSRIVHGKAWA